MDKIKLIKSTFLREKETKEALCSFIKHSEILSMGAECEKFEKNFALKQERKYAVYVANGSCANLLLIQAAINMGLIKRGDYVFVSSLTWPTNIMPLIQLGIVPILLDVERETFNVSSNILKEAFNKHPNAKAFFITNALGFCSDIDEITKFCEEKKILFLEDNCESLGSEYKSKKLGNFGHASTFSFFVGHHISTIEGGMICTDDKKLYENLKMSRAHGWTRNNSLEFKEEKKKEYNIDYFYDIYTFYELSYNFRPTEINGFLGNQQIKYWDEIVTKRKDNFKEFLQAVKDNHEIVKLDLKNMNIISNFGFPLLFNNKENFEKYKSLFLENKVEIRPIIGGNIAYQPFAKKWINSIELCKNANEIHELGFYFGNNPEMTNEEIERIKVLLDSKNE